MLFPIIHERIGGVKIDFTTIKDQANALPAAKSLTQIGFGLRVDFHRIGNIVFCCDNAVIGNAISRSTMRALTETIPDGYKPKSSGSMVGVLGYDGGSDNNTTMVWYVSSDGSMQFSCPHSIGGGIQCRYGITGVWITNDAWPTS